MEKIKLLLYCTKGKPLLYKGITAYTRSVEYVLDKEQYLFGKIETLNGKIVAECDFEVEKYRVEEYGNEMRVKCKVLYGNVGQYSGNDEMLKNILKGSCLTIQELTKYMAFKDMWSNTMYAIYIKNLNIFDEPRELSECWKNTNAWIFSNEKLYSAPQNMRYCGDWDLKKAILISIRPEWLVKILNGEKTIEIRRKVLKEMVK